MNILVVDDEPAILKALQSVLVMEGHAVHTAALPREAIESVRAAGAPFDLVITDQSMPDMSGPELACAVKDMSPSTSVVLLTGWSRSMGAGFPPGIDDMLQKPIRIADLRNFLNAFAQRAAAAKS
jgi:DNA-binding response OmpR family regulator